MNRKTVVCLAVLVGMSFLISGCVAAEAGGAGGSTYSRGKLSFTTSHDIHSCHDATIYAFADSDIKLTGDTTDGTGGRITGEKATGEKVTIDLEPQSKRKTTIEIRLGVRGDQAQSELIARAIKKRL